MLESLALRQQSAVLQRSRQHPGLRRRDPVLWVLLLHSIVTFRQGEAIRGLSRPSSAMLQDSTRIGLGAGSCALGTLLAKAIHHDTQLSTQSVLRPSSDGASSASRRHLHDLALQELQLEPLAQCL